MPKDYSPFTPGIPVPVEFFVGRLNEVERTINAVKASTGGRLQVLFLVGERGIGKSSLASFVKYISEQEHQVIGLHIFLGGVTTLEETVRRIFVRLLKDSIDKKFYQKITEFFGTHLKQIDLFGITIEFEADKNDLRLMVEDFAPTLRNLMDKLEEKKAILLILDDINGLANFPNFANWLKSLVDEIATSSKPLPLCLLLVGLEERRQAIISHQSSLARVFDVIEVKTWSETETIEFFKKAFSSVNIRVDERALSVLAKYTGGLPVLAHEIGDATFQLDTDNFIDKKDAEKGVINAAEIVGRKHLEPQVFQAIRSQKYRAILRKIAVNPSNISFRVGDIKPQLTRDEQRVFHNFLTKMKKLGVLQPDPDGEAGAYRFQNMLYYLYFWLETTRAKEKREQ